MSTDVRQSRARENRETFLGALAGRLAVLGGALSIALAALVVISVTGRYLFSSPIEGDFEVVKMATAVAVFSFLPYAQWRRSNIMVDTFTGWLPQSVQRSIDAFWDIVYAAFMTLVGVQLARGAMDSIRSGETMMQLPVLLWPAIAICASLSILVAAVSVATASRMWGSR